MSNETDGYPESYRIECLRCGSVAFGDPENSVQDDKMYHRDHCCPDAEFEVSEF